MLSSHKKAPAKERTRPRWHISHYFKPQQTVRLPTGTEDDPLNGLPGLDQIDGALDFFDLLCRIDGGVVIVLYCRLERLDAATKRACHAGDAAGTEQQDNNHQ